MKAYVCDACGTTITNPYDVKFKEFYVAVEFDLGTFLPFNTTRKSKVHLCDTCYHSLRKIAETRVDETDKEWIISN